MRTTAILNLKGGVAKTATAVNMAAILAGDHKRRVLLVDADSQCNTTEFVGGDPENGNLARALRDTSDEGVTYAMGAIQNTATEGVDVLPGSDSLMDLDLTKVEQRTVNAQVLRRLCANLADYELYDHVIIDCPPAFNAASAAALLAADEVIIPVKLDAFALRGMANLLRQVENMRRINGGLSVAGCLITMWYPSDQNRSAEGILRRGKLPVFRTVIRRTDKVDGMTWAQEPLNQYSPRSAAGVDYRRFVREWLGGAENV